MAKELVKKEGQEVDTALVNEACDKITNIFSKHVEEAVKETGEYLINEFFDGDYEKASKKDKIKNSSKGNTLNQVFDYFTRKRSDDDDEASKSPSKSWLYQAIDIVVQENDLRNREGLDYKTFQTSGKLLLSHKVALLTVKNIDEKEELIKKVVDENLTVRALKNEIANHEGGSDRIPGLLSIINKPENFFKDDCQEKLTLESLKKLGNKKLEKIPKRIKDKKKEIEAELNKLKEDINSNNSYLEKLSALEPTIKKAINETKETSRKRKQKTDD
jgi:hypothetical protein